MRSSGRSDGKTETWTYKQLTLAPLLHSKQNVLTKHTKKGLELQFSNKTTLGTSELKFHMCIF